MQYDLHIKILKLAQKVLWDGATVKDLNIGTHNRYVCHCIVMVANRLLEYDQYNWKEQYIIKDVTNELQLFIVTYIKKCIRDEYKFKPFASYAILFDDDVDIRELQCQRWMLIEEMIHYYKNK